MPFFKEKYSGRGLWYCLQYYFYLFILKYGFAADIVIPEDSCELLPFSKTDPNNSGVYQSIFRKIDNHGVFQSIFRKVERDFRKLCPNCLRFYVISVEFHIFRY